MRQAEKVWLDGRLVDWDEATVHVSAPSVQYGAGIFEGVRSYRLNQGGAAIFRLRDHLRRLRRSCHVYLLTPSFDEETLVEGCREVVSANAFTDCYIRPIVYLGPGENPLAAPLHTALIATESGPLAQPSEEGVTAKISSFRRIDANVIPPSAKATGQYLNGFLAKIEAALGGYGEPILLGTGGFVTDGWAQNVFVVQGGELLTPPLSSGALAGVTRATISTLATERDIPTREVQLTRTDLYDADECFLVGTAAQVLPVISVDDRKVGTGEVGTTTTTLKLAYDACVRGDDEGHLDWLEVV